MPDKPVVLPGTTAATRSDSRALFGGDHRLEICAAIAGLKQANFSNGTLREALKYPADSETAKRVINQNLTALARSSLLDHPKTGQWVRRPGKFWNLARTVYAELESKYRTPVLGEAAPEG